MFVTGPNVVKTVTHEEVSMENLGGAETHSSKSGVAHFAFENEVEVLQNIRRLLSYLPLNNLDEPPVCEYADPTKKSQEKLDGLVPENPNKPYNMHKAI